MAQLLRILNVTSFDKAVVSAHSQIFRGFSSLNSRNGLLKVAQALKDHKLYSQEMRAMKKLLLPHINSALFRNQYVAYRDLHTSSQQFNNEKDNKENDRNQDDKIYAAKMLAWVLMIFGIGLLFQSTISREQKAMTFITWNDFVKHILSKGEVESLTVYPNFDLVKVDLHEGAVIDGKQGDHYQFCMKIFDVQNFEEKLRKAEVNLGIKPENRVSVIFERKENNLKFLTFFIIAALIFYMFRSGKKEVKNIFSSFTKANFTIVDPHMPSKQPGIKFKDVAGLKEAKVEVMEFVDYLIRPENYSRLGAKVPKGAVLLGPPGCGKTLLAKALANEAGVPFLVMAGSEFIEVIGGLGAARVRSLFSEARKRAPCIVYIDEIDAIGRRRGAGSGKNSTDEEDQTLNQLLVELDGMASQKGVIMLASTNRPDVLDKALLRPGRFDRHVMIDLPNLIERREIFELHLKSIKLAHPPEKFSQRLAQLTPGFSGADIANVVNEAALHAARQRDSVVGARDLEYAVERVVGGTEKRSRVMAEDEKKIVAYHESGHALTGWLLEHTDALLKVTIVPRTNNMLGFAQYLPSDQKLYTREQLLQRMCMALGGRVAEAIIFNRVTSGAEDDLKKITKMAYAYVKQYGLSDVVGQLSFPDEKEEGVGRRPYSKRLANTIDEEARRLVTKAYNITTKTLNENKDKLKLVAETLIQKETLSYTDIEKLIGPPPFGKKTLIDPLELISFDSQTSTEQSGPNNGNGDN